MIASAFAPGARITSKRFLFLNKSPKIWADPAVARVFGRLIFGKVQSLCGVVQEELARCG